MDEIKDVCRICLKRTDELNSQKIDTSKLYQLNAFIPSNLLKFLDSLKDNLICDICTYNLDTVSRLQQQITASNEIMDTSLEIGNRRVHMCRLKRYKNSSCTCSVCAVCLKAVKPWEVATCMQDSQVSVLPWEFIGNMLLMSKLPILNVKKPSQNKMCKECCNNIQITYAFRKAWEQVEQRIIPYCGLYKKYNLSKEDLCRIMLMYEDIECDNTIGYPKRHEISARKEILEDDGSSDEESTEEDMYFNENDIVEQSSGQLESLEMIIKNEPFEDESMDNLFDEMTLQATDPDDEPPVLERQEPCSYTSSSNFLLNYDLYFKNRTEVPIKREIMSEQENRKSKDAQFKEKLYINISHMDQERVQSALHGTVVENPVFSKNMDKRKGNTRYKCDVCSFSTRHSSAYYRHKTYHNVKKFEVFRCPECSFKTIGKTVLTAHMKTHTCTKRDSEVNESKEDAVGVHLHAKSSDPEIVEGAFRERMRHMKITLERHKAKSCQRRNLKMCRRGCSKSISKVIQKKAYEDFWNLKGSERITFVSSLILRESTRTHNSWRAHNFKYHLKVDGSLLEVCKVCFLRILDLPHSFVEYVKNTDFTNVPLNDDSEVGERVEDSNLVNYGANSSDTEIIKSDSRETRKKDKMLKERQDRSPPLKCVRICQKRCSQNISKDIQKKLYDELWSLKTYEERVAFTASLILKGRTRGNTVNPKKLRRYIYKYHLRVDGLLVEVCKSCFTKILGIPSNFMVTVIKKAHIMKVPNNNGECRTSINPVHFEKQNEMPVLTTLDSPDQKVELSNSTSRRTKLRHENLSEKVLTKTIFLKKSILNSNKFQPKRQKSNILPRSGRLKKQFLTPDSTPPLSMNEMSERLRKTIESEHDYVGGNHIDTFMPSLEPGVSELLEVKRIENISVDQCSKDEKICYSSRRQGRRTKNSHLIPNISNAKLPAQVSRNCNLLEKDEIKNVSHYAQRSYGSNTSNIKRRGSKKKVERAAVSPVKIDIPCSTVDTQRFETMPPLGYSSLRLLEEKKIKIICQYPNPETLKKCENNVETSDNTQKGKTTTPFPKIRAIPFEKLSAQGPQTMPQLVPGELEVSEQKKNQILSQYPKLEPNKTAKNNISNKINDKEDNYQTGVSYPKVDVTQPVKLAKQQLLSMPKLIPCVADQSQFKSSENLGSEIMTREVKKETINQINSL